MKNLILAIALIFSAQTFAKPACPDLSGTYETPADRDSFFPIHYGNNLFHVYELSAGHQVTIEQQGCKRLAYYLHGEYRSEFRLGESMDQKVVFKKKSIHFFGSEEDGFFDTVLGLWVSLPSRIKVRFTQKKNGNLDIRYQEGATQIGLHFYFIPWVNGPDVLKTEWTKVK